MVSHDIEFCAKYAHRCAMVFDGAVSSEGTPRAFFGGNSLSLIHISMKTARSP